MELIRITGAHLLWHLAGSFPVLLVRQVGEGERRGRKGVSGKGHHPRVSSGMSPVPVDVAALSTL